jgi:hypothetical protein
MGGKRQYVLGHVEKDDILTFIFYSQSVIWWYKPEHNNTKTLEKDCLHVLWSANSYNTVQGGLHKGHHSSHLHKAWLTTGGKQERKSHRICEISIYDVLFPGTYCSLSTAPYSLFLFFSGINILLSAVDRTMSGGGGGRGDFSFDRFCHYRTRRKRVTRTETRTRTQTRTPKQSIGNFNNVTQKINKFLSKRP